jgi:ribosomal protein S13
MAVERLAAFFGIGKELMKAVLKSLHINPEDLVDPSQKDEIIKYLIKKFGLAKDRAEALSELIKEF